jgi:hypothetical protein
MDEIMRLRGGWIGAGILVGQILDSNLKIFGFSEF